MLENGAKQAWVGAMKRIGMAAIGVALAVSVTWPAERAAAQSASGMKAGAGCAAGYARCRAGSTVPPPRLRVTPYYEQDGVYPHYNPGPDAVRVCNAHYVQEFRPSGTVIVPRMSCYWTRG